MSEQEKAILSQLKSQEPQVQLELIARASQELYQLQAAIIAARLSESTNITDIIVDFELPFIQRMTGTPPKYMLLYCPGNSSANSIFQMALNYALRPDQKKSTSITDPVTTLLTNSGSIFESIRYSLPNNSSTPEASQTSQQATEAKIDISNRRVTSADIAELLQNSNILTFIPKKLITNTNPIDLALASAIQMNTWLDSLTKRSDLNELVVVSPKKHANQIRAKKGLENVKAIANTEGYPTPDDQTLKKLCESLDKKDRESNYLRHKIHIKILNRISLTSNTPTHENLIAAFALAEKEIQGSRPPENKELRELLKFYSETLALSLRNGVKPQDLSMQIISEINETALLMNSLAQNEMARNIALVDPNIIKSKKLLLVLPTPLPEIFFSPDFGRARIATNDEIYIAFIEGTRNTIDTTEPESTRSLFIRNYGAYIVNSSRVSEARKRTQQILTEKIPEAPPADRYAEAKKFQEGERLDMALENGAPVHVYSLNNTSAETRAGIKKTDGLAVHFPEVSNVQQGKKELADNLLVYEEFHRMRAGTTPSLDKRIAGDPYATREFKEVFGKKIKVHIRILQKIPLTIANPGADEAKDKLLYAIADYGSDPKIKKTPQETALLDIYTRILEGADNTLIAELITELRRTAALLNGLTLEAATIDARHHPQSSKNRLPIILLPDFLPELSFDGKTVNIPDKTANNYVVIANLRASLRKDNGFTDIQGAFNQRTGDYQAYTGINCKHVLQLQDEILLDDADHKEEEKPPITLRRPRSAPTPVVKAATTQLPDSLKDVDDQLPQKTKLLDRIKYMGKRIWHAREAETKLIVAEKADGSIDLTSDHKLLAYQIATLRPVNRELQYNERSLDLYANDPIHMYEAIHRIKREARLTNQKTTLLYEPLIVMAAVNFYKKRTADTEAPDARIEKTLAAIRNSLAYNNDRPNAWKGLNASELERISTLLQTFLEKYQGNPATFTEIGAQWQQAIEYADTAYFARVMKRTTTTVHQDTFIIRESQKKAIVEKIQLVLKNNFDDPLSRTTKEHRAAYKVAKNEVEREKAKQDPITQVADKIRILHREVIGLKEPSAEVEATVEKVAKLLSSTGDLRATVGFMRYGIQTILARGKTAGIREPSTRAGVVLFTGRFLPFPILRKRSMIPEVEEVAMNLADLPMLAAGFGVSWLGGNALANLIVEQIGTKADPALIISGVLLGVISIVGSRIGIKGVVPLEGLTPNIDPSLHPVLDSVTWGMVGLTIADILLAVNLPVGHHLLGPILVPMVLEVLQSGKKKIETLEIMERAARSAVHETDGDIAQAINVLTGKSI